jgi:phosphoribosyl-ATP pyrophosphohydrolase
MVPGTAAAVPGPDGAPIAQANRSTVAAEAVAAEAVAAEAADLLYHALVACHAAGAGMEDVLGVLERRSARAANSEP